MEAGKLVYFHGHIYRRLMRLQGRALRWDKMIPRLAVPMFCLALAMRDMSMEILRHAGLIRYPRSLKS